MSRTYIKVVTPYLKSVMKYLHVLTAVSDSGAEYAASLTDLPITIIPNGIDLKKYHQKAVAEESPPAPRLFSTLVVWNDAKVPNTYSRLFNCLPRIHPDVKLLIAGDGPDREKLELLAEDLKLKNVSFLGYISEELKLQLLAEADLFCSPALFGESFGIVLLEAMATGTVTVAGNNSGYADLMQGVGALSIVNPEDTAEFARRLQLLLYEAELRKIWQRWATQYVQAIQLPDYRRSIRGAL